MSEERLRIRICNFVHLLSTRNCLYETGGALLRRSNTKQKNVPIPYLIFLGGVRNKNEGTFFCFVASRGFLETATGCAAAWA